MDARDDILERLRRRLAGPQRDVGAARLALNDCLARRARGPRPRLSGDLVQRFSHNSEALSSTVERVPTMAAAPVAVARYLQANVLPMTCVCWPQVAELPWHETGIAVTARAARDADMVGITGAFCAVAETGTLMLCSAAATPATVSLLPETHIAIVEAARIVADMEEAWQLARAELGELPRAVNFISGPSRTGDIELTIVLGAHGPYRVHIIVVG
jgi:L-lactate dehydrogenase complex protein LldG